MWAERPSPLPLLLWHKTALLSLCYQSRRARCIYSVRISESCSGKAAVLLLKRTSSIAFYQECSVCWHFFITFSFRVEFVISKWEITLIRITYNCWHETNRKMRCVHRCFRRAVPMVLLEKTTRHTRALKTSAREKLKDFWQRRLKVQQQIAHECVKNASVSHRETSNSCTLYVGTQDMVEFPG
jgi:hypothetical protein